MDLKTPKLLECKSLNLLVKLLTSRKKDQERKKIFDYESNDEYRISSEEAFRRDYFLILIDRATEALKVRFEYQSTFNSNFGFLYRIGKLKHQDIILY